MQNLTSLKQRSNGAVEYKGAGKVGLGIKGTANFVFDVAGKDSTGVANTTVAAHGTGVILPIGAVIVGGFIKTTTILAGAGASLSIGVMSATDIQTTAAYNAAPWSTTGLKAITPKANTPESTGIECTSAKEIVCTVTGAVLSAGRVTGVLEYVVLS